MHVILLYCCDVHVSSQNVYNEHRMHINLCVENVSLVALFNSLIFAVHQPCMKKYPDQILSAIYVHCCELCGNVVCFLGLGKVQI